jgi:hypothetical protein
MIWVRSKQIKIYKDHWKTITKDQSSNLSMMKKMHSGIKMNLLKEPSNKYREMSSLIVIHLGIKKHKINKIYGYWQIIKIIVRSINNKMIIHMVQIKMLGELLIKLEIHLLSKKIKMELVNKIWHSMVLGNLNPSNKQFRKE